MSASGSNVTEEAGIGYIVGEPGMLIMDTSSSPIRTLLYTYTPQPNVAFSPPVGFAQGSSVVDLTTALRSGGAILPPGQDIATTLSQNHVVYYQGTNAFKGPTGSTGPGASDSQVLAQVNLAHC